MQYATHKRSGPNPPKKGNGRVCRQRRIAMRLYATLPQMRVSGRVKFSDAASTPLCKGGGRYKLSVKLRFASNGVSKQELGNERWQEAWERDDKRGHPHGGAPTLNLPISIFAPPASLLILSVAPARLLPISAALDCFPPASRPGRPLFTPHRPRVLPLTSSLRAPLLRRSRPANVFTARVRRR